MASFFLAVYQHVVDLDFYIPPYLVMEHSVHKPLVDGSCVFQPEWHNLVTEKSSACDEGCLLLVSLVHHYLIIS